MVCWLPVFKGLGCWHFDDLAATFDENIDLKFGVSSGRKNLLAKGLNFEEFDATEPGGDWPFRELSSNVLDVTCQSDTSPDIPNAVRAVVRYTNSPREVHWKATFGILKHVIFTGDSGVTFRRGSGLQVVANESAAYASTVTVIRTISARAVICAGACVCRFSRTHSANV